jgi:hypothetical protein
MSFSHPFNRHAELRALLRVLEDGGMQATTEVTEYLRQSRMANKSGSKDREKNPK